MADKHENELLSEPEFCEYVWRNGQYWLIDYHTHEGNYCYSYQSSEQGQAREKQPPGRVPGSQDLSTQYRQFGIYEFVESENGGIALQATDAVGNNVLQKNLFGELEKRGLNALSDALATVGRMARLAEFDLQIAISPQDLGDAHTNEHVHGAEPEFGFGIYEFHRLDDGRFTFLPVHGTCTDQDDPSATDRFFPTDLSAFLDLHHQQFTKALLVGICSTVLKAVKLRLRIVVRSKFISECIGEGHDADHDGV